MKKTPKTKTVKFSFDTCTLMGGVSDMYQDLLDDGMDSEEALHLIMGDAILNYYLFKKYPNWLPAGSSSDGEGNYEVQLEKIEF